MNTMKISEKRFIFILRATAAFIIVMLAYLICQEILEKQREAARQEIISDVDSKVNSFYSRVESQGHQYKKNIDSFFHQKSQNTKAFAEFIVENSGDMPSDDVEKAKWIKYHFERHFFSNIDIANLVKRNNQEYIAVSISAANDLAISIEKEYVFDVNKQSNIDTTSIDKQHQELLRYSAKLINDEYYNSWLAEGGSFATAAIVVQASSAIGGKVFGAKAGSFLGPLGFLAGLGLGAIVDWFIGDWLKEERIIKIEKELNNALDKTKNILENSTVYKLVEIDEHRSNKWRKELKIALIEHKELS